MRFSVSPLTEYIYKAARSVGHKDEDLQPKGLTPHISSRSKTAPDLLHGAERRADGLDDAYRLCKVLALIAILDEV